MSNKCYFGFIFCNLCVKKTICIPYYLTTNVQMMYVLLFIIPNKFSMKFLDYGILLTFSVLQNFIIAEYKKASNFSENNIFLEEKSFWEKKQDEYFL